MKASAAEALGSTIPQSKAGSEENIFVSWETILQVGGGSSQSSLWYKFGSSPGSH